MVRDSVPRRCQDPFSRPAAPVAPVAPVHPAPARRCGHHAANGWAFVGDRLTRAYRRGFEVRAARRHPCDGL